MPSGRNKGQTGTGQEINEAGTGADLPSVGTASAAETGTCEHLVHRHKTSRGGAAGTPLENRQASLELGPETGNSAS